LVSQLLFLAPELPNLGPFLLLKFDNLLADDGLPDLLAENGRYLAPFARILLAIAYVREKETAHAREL
jgi:hypothetical protein